MKKYIWICTVGTLLSLVIFINSCVEEDDYRKNVSYTTTRAPSYQNLKATITGEKAPYVGEYYYTYTVTLSEKLSGSAIVRINTNGSAALFRFDGGNFMSTSTSFMVSEGKTTFTFDVFWVKEIDSVCLFIGTDIGAPRQIEGSLCDIKVQTRPISISGGKNIFVGDEIELYAAYDRIDNNHRAQWDHNPQYFARIEQRNDNSKYYAKFKAIKETSDNTESSDISLNIEEIYLISNWLCVRKGEASIAVKTRPISISGGRTIYLGDEVDLSAEYDKIDDNHREEWTYNRQEFQLIKKWNDDNTYYARFKAIKEIPDNISSQSLNISLDIDEFYESDWLRIRTGEVPITVKNPFYYRYSPVDPLCSGSILSIEMPNLNSDANINWMYEGPIEIISGQGTSNVSFHALNDIGYASITANVRYKELYKTKKISNFWVGLPLLTFDEGIYKQTHIPTSSYSLTTIPAIPDQPEAVTAYIPVYSRSADRLECRKLSGDVNTSVSIVGEKVVIQSRFRSPHEIQIQVTAFNSCGSTSIEKSVNIPAYVPLADYVSTIEATNGKTTTVTISGFGIEPLRCDELLLIPWISMNINEKNITFTFNYNNWLSAGKPSVFYANIFDSQNRKYIIRINVDERGLPKPWP